MMAAIGIFLLFCYYGCLCFGGGSALTPIYIDDLVNSQHWMTLTEFGDLTAISQMTPGPIGVNVATFFGFRRAGIAGAAAATFGLLLPSYFLMIIALKSIHRWQSSRVVRGILAGIRPATVGMVAASLLIFLGMSVFTEQIPWHQWWSAAAWPEGFALRPGALAIFLVSTLVLYRTGVSIFAVVFASAALGMLCC